MKPKTSPRVVLSILVISNNTKLTLLVRDRAEGGAGGALPPPPRPLLYSKRKIAKIHKESEEK